jgi:dihydrofolate reductase
VKVSLVAAVARGGVIGNEGGIPWRLPEDVAQFKELTTGHAVVMGRRTWDSIAARFRPLPDRRNVVVTRDPEWQGEGAERAGSVEEALALLAGEEHVFVIGGAEIYAAALPHADELVLTEIDLEVEGDTFFPDWDRASFDEESRREQVSDAGTAFSVVRYRRSATAGQLAALADVSARLRGAVVDHWLFGGWAVDFYAGRVTRPHFDVDLAVWLDDLPRIGALLEASGWRHAPDADEDGGTGYERDGTRLELTYLSRDDRGAVVTPLREGAATWPAGAFADDERRLHGVRARLVSLDALAGGKSTPRDDPGDAEKDRADFGVLSALEDAS